MKVLGILLGALLGVLLGILLATLLDTLPGILTQQHYIGKPWKTLKIHEMCIRAIEEDPYNLKFIPDHFIARLVYVRRRKKKETEKLFFKHLICVLSIRLSKTFPRNI